MEASPSAMLKLLLPKTPFILKTALAHTLSMSPTSSKWDLRTEITINILRDMIGPKGKPSSITSMQRLTTKDPGVKGKVWISKVKFDVPGEDDARQAMFKAIDDLSTGGETWEKPESKPLEAEWTGHRAGVSDTEPEPTGVSEQEKYASLIKETTSKVTMLYFHGGAMYLLDPATYRPTTGRLARETGGRVFNVRYRLAPQNPFPAALLDAFTAYLTLLHPPPGATHDAVPASDIVFGGDSAGGMLCAILMQLLLQLHRSNDDKSNLPTVRWYGEQVAIPLPAGAAMTSPWLDVTRSLPSIEKNAHYDYLPPPSLMQKMRYPPCDAWPTDPPRADLYCDGSALLHPLVSPVAAMDWTGAPPMFFSLGEEMLRDEDAVLGKRLHSQGVAVRWREFEAMPHVFGMMLEALPAAALHFEETVKFVRDAAEGKVTESSAQFISARTLERKSVELDKVTDITDAQLVEAMKVGKERIEKKHGDAVAETRPML